MSGRASPFRTCYRTPRGTPAARAARPFDTVATMSRTPRPASDRRSFLRHVAASTAAAGLATAVPSALLAAPAVAPDDEKWLGRLVGKHRQIFDMPQPAGGLPMIHVRNFLNTYRDAYGLRHPDVSAAVGLYYMTVPLAFTDAVWAKYQLGAASSVVDADTKAPAVRNPLWKPRDGATALPMAGGPLLPPNDTAITELQARGTQFILCNNALGFWAANIAKATKQAPDAVRAELVAHLIPGVTIVPAMVIAFNRAQEAGVTYMFLP